MFLLVYIVVVRVVASQRDERAQAQSVGKEDLSCCIQPHLSGNRYQYVPIFMSVRLQTCVIRCFYLGPDEFIEVWSNVEADPIYGSRQRDPTKEQDEQHEVGIGG